MDFSTPSFPVLHHFLELTQTHIFWVSYTIQPCHPVSSPLLLPSVFPSIRVFSNELAFHISWAQYWNFSFSISPSSEYSGLISFRIDWFDLLAVPECMCLKTSKDYGTLSGSWSCVWQLQEPKTQIASCQMLVFNLLSSWKFGELLNSTCILAPCVFTEFRTYFLVSVSYIFLSRVRLG